MSNRPVDSIKDYPVEIAIFEHQNADGRWHNADVSKTYKDGDEYKRTRNFSRTDLLKLNALLPQALNRMQELAQGQSQAPAQPSEGIDIQSVKEDAQALINGKADPQDQGMGQ